MPKKMHRRAALALLAATAIAAPNITGVSINQDDPILAAIENHRAAWARSEAALRDYQADRSENASAYHDKCSAAIDAAEAALRDARPTTVAGAAALAAYLFTEMQDKAFDQPDGEALLDALVDGLRSLAANS
jgi:hypothetical protein